MRKWFLLKLVLDYIVVIQDKLFLKLLDMRTRIFFMSALAAFGLQSCNNENRGGRDAAATSVTDSLTDTTQRAQNYTADVEINGDEKSFILPAAAGGMMEVAAGNLIIEKSTNPAVKAFATRMVKDHTKANNELEGIAKEKGLTVPATLPEEQLKHIAAMKTLSGRSLDVHYITMMIDDHVKTIDLFGKATGFKDAKLKNFALTILPVIQEHYKLAEELGKKLNISNVNNGDDIGGVSTSAAH